MACFTASAYVLCWYVRVDSSKSHRDVLGFQPENLMEWRNDPSNFLQKRDEGGNKYKLIPETRYNTKLFVDDGHVWNSLVAVVISFTVELLGANINSGSFNFRFSTYLWVDLQKRKWSNFNLMIMASSIWAHKNHFYDARMETQAYLGHHLSKLSNSNFIVRVANIEDVTICSGWIFLDKDIILQ